MFDLLVLHARHDVEHVHLPLQTSIFRFLLSALVLQLLYLLLGFSQLPLRRRQLLVLLPHLDLVGVHLGLQRLDFVVRDTDHLIEVS